MGHTLVAGAAARLALVVVRLPDILVGSVALDAGSIQPGRIERPDTSGRLRVETPMGGSARQAVAFSALRRHFGPGQTGSSAGSHDFSGPVLLGGRVVLPMTPMTIGFQDMLRALSLDTDQRYGACLGLPWIAPGEQRFFTRTDKGRQRGVASARVKKKRGIISPLFRDDQVDQLFLSARPPLVVETLVPAAKPGELVAVDGHAAV
jgi:hypothetical protein